MTRKETQALMLLISAINSAVSDMNYYSVDYDCEGLGSTADNLQEALHKFRKEAKI